MYSNTSVELRLRKPGTAQAGETARDEKGNKFFAEYMIACLASETKPTSTVPAMS
jgi:hypothetical protein